MAADDDGDDRPTGAARRPELSSAGGERVAAPGQRLALRRRKAHSHS